MDIIKEGAGFTQINAVKLIMSEWVLRLRELHLISATTFSSLLREPADLIPLNRALDGIKRDLDTDYYEFVTKMAKDDSTMSVAIRFAYKRYDMALNRLRNTLSAIASTSSLFDREGRPVLVCDEFYTRSLLIPSKSVYHSGGLETISDLTHALFMRASVHEHIKRITPQQERPSVSEEEDDLNVLYTNYREPEFKYVYSNPDMNNMCEYACLLSSYPVLPPDLTGNIRITRGFSVYVPLGLSDPGMDSRRRVTDTQDYRSCVACKLNNLSAGYTDIIEQDKRTRCYCVTSKLDHNAEYFTVLTNTKASMKVRESVIQEKGGCNCVKHRAVADSKLMTFMEALKQARMI